MRTVDYDDLQELLESEPMSTVNELRTKEDVDQFVTELLVNQGEEGLAAFKQSAQEIVDSE